MKPATGGWVTGDDFFGREADLRQLESRVRDRNPVLLTGQRRIGKTSIVRELGRRMEAEGWTFLFADVENATAPEEFVTEIAEAVYRLRRRWLRFDWSIPGRWTEEIEGWKLRAKFRDQLNPGNWQRRGRKLLAECARHRKPVLFVVDELPIFLGYLIDERGDGAAKQFLSWFRGVVQDLNAAANPPALILSGSIGLEGLARRIGASDRINHLYPYRLGPWTRKECVECFQLLAQSVGLPTEPGVAGVVYDKLGLGIPHHVQSFLARLHDYYVWAGSASPVTTSDVERVYRTHLLGPPGQSDLRHYEGRLKDALDDDCYTLAMEILAEASAVGSFTSEARQSLEHLYADVEDIARQVAYTVDTLVHDGYIHYVEEEGQRSYVFSSNLLKDWWYARFRDHYEPLGSRRRRGRSRANE